MRAIALVGGEGTRLRPLTWRTPKALVPVLGRPLLDHLLLRLRAHGIDHVTLALTHRNEAIRDAFGDGGRLGLRVDYAYEDSPLGSGGAIGAAAQAWRDAGWQDETFLVVNGDVITDLDISAMIEAHRARQAVLSISLQEVEDPSPFGVVEIDGEGRIHRFVEKPPIEEAPSRLINAGTWLFEPQLIDMLDPAAFNRVEDGLFPDLCAAGEPVYGFHQDSYWADIGNPTALLDVNLAMAAGTVSSPTRPHVEGARYIDASVSIEADARVETSVIGVGCSVGGGATVSRSLLWDDVTVEAGAMVEGSILATGVRVGADARVSGCVVGHGVQIAGGVTLIDQRVDPATLEDLAGVRTP